METQTIDLSQLSAEELENALKAKKEKAKKEYEKRKEDYEVSKDELVTFHVKKAKELFGLLKEFKKGVIEDLEEFREKATEYGGVKKSSKGGYGLRSVDGQHRIVLSRNIKSIYDEKADFAEELIKEFLEDKVKKRDLQTFRTITALLSRNKAGDYTPAQISRLLQIEDNYQDDRWTRAMQLFKESYREVDVSFNVEFYERDKENREQPIILTFASIPLD